MSKKIIIIVKNNETKKVIKKSFLKSFYTVYYLEDVKEALDVIYNEAPDLIVIDVVNNPFIEFSIINSLKRDLLSISMNVVAIVSDDFYTEDWKNFIVDDYIRLSNLSSDLLMRVSLCFDRIERVVATSPLTKLPGNIAIQKEIQREL